MIFEYNLIFKYNFDIRISLPYSNIILIFEYHYHIRIKFLIFEYSNDIRLWLRYSIMVTIFEYQNYIRISKSYSNIVTIFEYLITIFDQNDFQPHGCLFFNLICNYNGRRRFL